MRAALETPRRAASVVAARSSSSSRWIIGAQRLYRPDTDAGGWTELGPVLTRPIRWELIARHYDQMVKYATALRLRTAEAEAILRRFTRPGPQHPTHAALVELGRAVKTIFLCGYLRVPGPAPSRR